MIYPLEGTKSEKEYVGSGYLDDDIKLTIYRQDDLFIGYVGNNETSSYPTSEFTVMEALYLTSVGCEYAESSSDIDSRTYDLLGTVEITDIDITESSQYEYHL